MATLMWEFDLITNEQISGIIVNNLCAETIKVYVNGKHDEEEGEKFT